MLIDPIPVLTLPDDEEFKRQLTKRLNDHREDWQQWQIKNPNVPLKEHPSYHFDYVLTRILERGSINTKQVSIEMQNEVGGMHPQQLYLYELACIFLHSWISRGRVETFVRQNI